MSFPLQTSNKRVLRFGDPLIGTHKMAVGADQVAFLQLGLYSCPGFSQEPRDVGGLLPSDVVEDQNSLVCVSAVLALTAEVLDSLTSVFFPPFSGLNVLSGFVLFLVLFLIVAHVVIGNSSSPKLNYTRFPLLSQALFVLFELRKLLSEPLLLISDTFSGSFLGCYPPGFQNGLDLLPILLIPLFPLRQAPLVVLQTPLEVLFGFFELPSSVDVVIIVVPVVILLDYDILGIQSDVVDVLNLPQDTLKRNSVVYGDAVVELTPYRLLRLALEPELVGFLRRSRPL